jgi:hypothetical protein
MALSKECIWFSKQTLFISTIAIHKLRFHSTIILRSK